MWDDTKAFTRNIFLVRLFTVSASVALVNFVPTMNMHLANVQYFILFGIYELFVTTKHYFLSDIIKLLLFKL